MIAKRILFYCTLLYSILFIFSGESLMDYSFIGFFIGLMIFATLTAACLIYIKPSELEQVIKLIKRFK